MPKQMTESVIELLMKHMLGQCAGAHADWADSEGDRRHHFSILQGSDWLQIQWAGDGDALA